MYILNVLTGKMLFGLESTDMCSGVLVNHQSIINEDSRSRSRKQGSRKSLPLYFSRLSKNRRRNNIQSSVVIDQLR